jgi:hypothetical protein
MYILVNTVDLSGWKLSLESVVKLYQRSIGALSEESGSSKRGNWK